MEASGVTPRGAIHAPDLARLFDRPGPFLSLYLTTEAEIANAAQRSQQRWKSVRESLAKDTVALLQKFKEEKGQHERAADGVAATTAALAQAQVEVLLVRDDPDDERTAWLGPEPVHLADRPDDLQGMGVETRQQGRLVDVLLRAAVGTGAGERIVPGASNPTEGVGAILRWA